MLERGIAVRQGIGFLRTELPTILATRTDALSPRMLRFMSLWQLKTIEHDLVDVGPAIVARACEMVGRDRSGRDGAAAVRRPRRVWARALRLVNYRHLVMKQLLVRLLHRLSAIRRAVFALRL
jgi:hypothetical protein